MRTFGTAADLVLNVNWSYWGQNKRGLNVTLVTFCHTCHFLSHLSCPITFCYILSYFVTFCHTFHILSHLSHFVTLVMFCHTVTFVTLLHLSCLWHLWWSISLTLWHNIDGHKATIQNIYICLGEIYTGKIPPPFQQPYKKQTK